MTTMALPALSNSIFPLFFKRRSPLMSNPARLIRILVAIVVGLSIATGPITRANATAPVVPLVTTHHYWDHHWFVWLPRHPVYESAEIMTIDTVEIPYRAVWVFFTERDGGKRQIHFFDDRRIVESFAGSHYRTIDYERTGTPDRGQSVRVSLIGLDDVPIDIAIDLADQPLNRIGAGLTDQSGHAADILFLLFHRERNALARTNEVHIGGSDYSFRTEDDPEGKYRFKASYSAGIQIGIIPFGRWTFTRDEMRLSAPAAGLSFTSAAHDAGTRLTASPPGYRNRIAVDLDATGALTGYRHDAGTHRLGIELDAALPLADDAPQTTRGFSVHLNPDMPVARGVVISEPMEGGRRLTWRIRSPGWAEDYPFESTIRANGSGYELTIRSLRRLPTRAPAFVPPCQGGEGLRAERGCSSGIPLSSGMKGLKFSSPARPASG